MSKSKYRMGKPKKILYEKLEQIEQKLDALNVPQDFRIQKEDLEKSTLIGEWTLVKHEEEDDTIGAIIIGGGLLVLTAIIVAGFVKAIFF